MVGADLDVGVARNVAYMDERWVVPGFAGDSPVVLPENVLGTEHDVEAVSVLVASGALTPPLAIGVYGNWGTGKTFFMRSLERHVDRLTRRELPGLCRDVVSVWFNAWHYAEGNLWASLIHQIFASLLPGGAAPDRVFDEALATVQGVREAKAEAAAAVHQAQDSTDAARKRLENVDAAYRQARERAETVGVRDLWAAVTIDTELCGELNEAAAALGLPAVAGSAREAADAARDIRTAAGRGLLLATSRPRWRSPLAVGLLAAVVISAGGVVAALLVHWSRGWLAPTVAATAQGAALVGGAAAWVVRQAGLVRWVLRPADRVQRQIEERLAVLDAEHRAVTEVARQALAWLEGDLAAARAALQAAEARTGEAEEELQSLTGIRLLERYLAERAGSADYAGYLGVVALAHRDLKDLSAYLERAAGGIDRIVLYVDDLDRCTPETVVRVLEAVHLLLALPLFVVVVGVDARWLERSIEEQRPAVGAGTDDYLDKIFQLNYQLQVMTADGCADLLVATARATQTVVARADTAPVAQPEVDTVVERATPEMSVADQVPAPAVRAAVEAMTLDEAELGWLRAVAPLVGTSPRRAKRFLNVYRVVKARVLMDQSIMSGNRRGLLVAAALAVGLPELMPAAFDGLKSEPSAVTESLRSWIEDRHDNVRLSAFIADGGELCDLPMTELVRWLPVLRPFAWPLQPRPAAGGQMRRRATAQ